MESIQSDVVIIGAGLTGLTLAYLLRDSGMYITLVEARNRIGGRILTSESIGKAPIEMGATWLGKKHTHLNELLRELGVGIFEQVLGRKAVYEPISTSPHQLVSLPENEEPSYRIVGGTATLITALRDQLNNARIHLGKAVHSLREAGEQLEAQTNQQLFRAPYVVSTLPPKLLGTAIAIHPPLPAAVATLLEKTHTWMGESIKIGLRYATPFWRDDNRSGTVFSNVGPITELYDHSSADDRVYALKGFLNGAYFSLSRAERKEMVLAQLEKYYGAPVHAYLDYEEAVWRQERFTFVAYPSHVLPHQHNGDPRFRNAFLTGRFFLAGTETASQFPGYMEGAVVSAKLVADQILNAGLAV